MKRNHKRPDRGLPGQTVFLAVAVVVSGGVLGYLALSGNRGPPRSAEAAVSRLRLEDIPFNGARAYGYLKQLCAIGRRPSGSPGMQSQQKLLAAHFQKLGGQVEFQRFDVRHPVDGSALPMANLIVRWHPQSKDRILLCTHYDTLPYPMLDRRNPKGTFVGANDGTSGVAVLMELAHEMPKLPSKYGVDFALFDGEEFVFSGPNGRYVGSFFLGSEHFCRAYAEDHPPYRYRWGVLLDMVGDADLQIYQERYSVSWKDSSPLVEEIWATARRLGVQEFIPRQKYAVQDDHLSLHDIGKIPACDLIDFDYPPWHTQGDTPQRCSALSLAKVGWVLREWLKAAE
jgi:glutaminyl-peptide cyclotransferase